MRGFKLLLFNLAFLIIAGCSNATDSDNRDVPSQNSMEFSHNNQDFQIIPLYEELLEFTNSAIENPQETQSAYYTKVTQPLQGYAAEQDINIGSTYNNYLVPSHKLLELQNNIVALLNNQETINTSIKEALINSSQQLTGSEKTIFILPSNPEHTIIKNMNGVGGYTLSDNAILLLLDPSFKVDALKYVVSHEYHHSVFMERNGEKTYTLLDSFIFEGKAESFAKKVYPEFSAPWTEPLSPEEEQIVLNGLKDHAESTSWDLYNDYLNGDYAKGIPLWSLYKVGFKLTQNYLINNPDMPIEEWTYIDSKVIVQESESDTLLVE